MTIEFSNDRPIYLQLIEIISAEIIRGERLAGDKMPSVREYAFEVGVNSNTIQRVYKELEQMEVTETRRGQGTFITTNEAVLEGLREQTKKRLIQQFLKDVHVFGFTKEEVLTMLAKAEG